MWRAFITYLVRMEQTGNFRISLESSAAAECGFYRPTNHLPSITGAHDVLDLVSKCRSGVNGLPLELLALLEQNSNVISIEATERQDVHRHG